jgi:hypothetical protein
MPAEVWALAPLAAVTVLSSLAVTVEAIRRRLHRRRLVREVRAAVARLDDASERTR